MTTIEPLPQDGTTTSGVSVIPDTGGPPNNFVDVSNIEPKRHIGRWLSAVGVLIVAGVILTSVLRNPRMQISVIEDYLFNRAILTGIAVTLELTVLCMLIAIILGTTVAIMRVSANPVLLTVGSLYVWFFRGVPVLVQLIFWYNLAALFPTIGIGLPGSSLLIGADTNSVISGFTAALLGLGLYEAAYMAEIIRGGIESINPGQREAAKALGMPPSRIMRRIVIPQAMRVIIPPTGNELIGMLKNTSLVSVIAAAELLTVTQNIYARTFEVIPLLMVATIWYLILTSIATVLVTQAERYYGRGSRTRETSLKKYLQRRTRRKSGAPQ